MKVESIEDLFLDELKDLYSAEKQITKALPKLVKAASDPGIKRGLRQPLARDEGSCGTPGRNLPEAGEEGNRQNL